MEELLVLALLLDEDMVTEEAYHKRLDELFLNDAENDDLLYLEWETNIKKAILYIRTRVDGRVLDEERFERILMSQLKGYYNNGVDIKDFADRMYHVWGNLPGTLQNREPFFTLSYADDPLSWGDEEQTRSIYENLLNDDKN